MAHDSVFTMPLSTLEKNVAKIEHLLDEVSALLPGLVAMTDEEVRQSDGKFKHGEADALASVLDAADARPAVFEALAAKDGGKDPNKLETGLLRERLERIALLTRVQAALAKVDVSHSILHEGEDVKPVLLAGYHIGKVNAPHDDLVATKMQPALNFYSRISRKSAKTRTEQNIAKDQGK
jgi:hypothetical protein